MNAEGKPCLTQQPLPAVPISAISSVILAGILRIDSTIQLEYNETIFERVSFYKAEEMI